MVNTLELVNLWPSGLLLQSSPPTFLMISPPLPDNISVLEFFLIESSLKAISSDYGSNKESNVHLETRNLKQTELHRLKNKGKKG